MAKTIAVVTMVSLRLGQVTRATSWRTCWTNSAAIDFAMSADLKGRGNSYPYGDSPGPFPAGRAGTASSVGRSGGARTPNPRFWRPVLYQLSYTPKIKDVTVPSCREMAPDRRSPRRGAVVIAD